MYLFQYKNESEMMLYKCGWKSYVDCNYHKLDMSQPGHAVFFKSNHCTEM